MNTNRPSLPAARPGLTEPASSKRKFSSKQLFDSQNEIVIEHHGDEYRLRITSNGKLILTK